MAQEIETKVLEVDTTQISNRLTELGAKQVQDGRLAVYWYGVAKVAPAEQPWFLRVRTLPDGVAEMTWKAKEKRGQVARQVTEINLNITQPDAAKAFLAAVGLEQYAFQEKDRTSWLLDKWRFDLDRYPGMLPFLEIEGTSETHVAEALAKLGLTEHRTWQAGERTLIEDIYKLDWCHMEFSQAKAK